MPPKSRKIQLYVVAMVCEEDFRHPCLLMKWQVIFPNLAMVLSMVWAQDSQQWCRKALKYPLGIIPGPGTAPQHGLDAARGSSAVSALGWGPELQPWYSI